MLALTAPAGAPAAAMTLSSSVMPTPVDDERRMSVRRTKARRPVQSSPRAARPRGALGRDDQERRAQAPTCARRTALP